MLGLLAVFARERHDRMKGLIELNNAYRGTALVLGDVVEADDGYTGDHCQGRRSTRARGRRPTRTQRRTTSQPRIRRAPARRRQDRDPERDHQQARQARPSRMGHHHHAHARGTEDARPGGWLHAQRRPDRPAHTTSAGTAAATQTDSQAKRYPSKPESSPVCDTWNAMRTNRSYRHALNERSRRAPNSSPTPATSSTPRSWSPFSSSSNATSSNQTPISGNNSVALADSSGR